MAPASEPSSATPPWRDGIALALAVFAVCVLLTRGVWHGLDAYAFLSHLERGVWVNPRHPLYLPLAGLVVEVLRPFGVSVLRGALIASSLGAALGALFFHRAAAAFGLARADALRTAAIAVACFGVLYYGSMVEIHAVFLFPAGLAWWAFAKWQRAPGATRALVLGCATGFAAATHATGHWLLVVFAMFAVDGTRNFRELVRLAPQAIAIALPHAAIAWVVPHLVLPAEVLADTAPEAGAASYFAFLRSLGTDWGQFPRVLWYEWLMPAMPLSLLAPLALLRKGTRSLAIAFVLSLGFYLLLTTFLLAPLAVMQKPEYLPPFATYEFGAYFLPLLLPAAMLAQAVVPARARWGLAVVGIVWALVQMFSSPRAPSDLDYGRDALAVLDERNARLVVGGYGELDGVLHLRPDCGSEPMHSAPRTVLTVYGLWLWLFRFPEYRKPELVFAWFDVQVQQVRAQGGQVLLTDEALELLRATKDGLLDRLADEHLPAKYELRRVEQGRFHGFEVVPK